MCSKQRKKQRRRLGGNTVGPAMGKDSVWPDRRRVAQKRDPSAGLEGHATKLDCTLTTVGGGNGFAAREGHAQICTKQEPSGDVPSVYSCR